ncbi:MAG: sulfatase-like hydrolase/transferase [Nocardioides sp.]
MVPVQRRPVPGWRAVGARLLATLLTVLAALLVVAALTTPERLEQLDLGAFVRLPLELIVYLALVLAVPDRFPRLRTGLAVVCGLLLALSAVFKVLDLGFREALNRPFDVLIDWTYADSLIETAQDSVDGQSGTLLLVGAGLALVALLVLVPLAVLRLTRVAVRNRGMAVPTVAALAATWLVLAGLQVRSETGPVASRDTAGYVYGQVARIPGQLRDRREFLAAAQSDPLREVAPDQLLTGLRGKDVVLVFVESYGRVAIEGSSFSPGVIEVLDDGTAQLEDAGFASRSAFLTSPTFGAISWLAHATLQAGLWVDNQQRYDVLVTSPRQTLSSLFESAGWRTVGMAPSNNRDWPQGEFYGFDQFYDSRNVGYEGPRFGYPTMPDQYTLDAFHRLELAPSARPPVMAEIDLITSHAPWSRVPRLIDQAAVGDGSVFEGMPEQLPSAGDIWPEPERVKAAYGGAIEYSLSALVRFVTTYGDDDLVLVVVGDHQPATIVSGPDAGYDVPVAVVAKDPAVIDGIEDWGWDGGLRPRSDAPVWRMDEFRDRFVAAYSSSGQTGTRPVTGR